MTLQIIKPQIINTQIITKIINAFTKSLHVRKTTNNDNIDNIITRIIKDKEKTAVLIPKRTFYKDGTGHIHYAIFYKNLLLICNRGAEAVTSEPGIKIYDLSKLKKREEEIDSSSKSLYKKFLSTKEEKFSDSLFNMEALICYIPSKPQKVGNCSYASTRLALKGLLLLEKLQENTSSSDTITKIDLLKASKSIEDEYKKIVIIDRKYNIENFIKNLSDENGNFISNNTKEKFFELSCRWFAQQSWPIRKIYLEVGSFIYNKLKNDYDDDTILKKIEEFKNTKVIRELQPLENRLFTNSNHSSFITIVFSHFYVSFKYYWNYAISNYFISNKFLLNKVKDYKEEYPLLAEKISCDSAIKDGVETIVKEKIPSTTLNQSIQEPNPGKIR